MTAASTWALVSSHDDFYFYFSVNKPVRITLFWRYLKLIWEHTPCDATSCTVIHGIQHLHIHSTYIQHIFLHFGIIVFFWFNLLLQSIENVQGGCVWFQAHSGKTTLCIWFVQIGPAQLDLLLPGGNSSSAAVSWIGSTYGQWFIW